MADVQIQLLLLLLIQYIIVILVVIVMILVIVTPGCGDDCARRLPGGLLCARLSSIHDYRFNFACLSVTYVGFAIDFALLIVPAVHHHCYLSRFMVDYRLHVRDNAKSAPDLVGFPVSFIGYIHSPLQFPVDRLPLVWCFQLYIYIFYPVVNLWQHSQGIWNGTFVFIHRCFFPFL